MEDIKAKGRTTRRLAVATLCALLTLPVLATAARAAFFTTPTQVFMTGEIERLSLNNPADVWSGGTMVVGGQNVILPRNLMADFPANRLTLQQIFLQAPAACVARSESGLAKSDLCNSEGKGALATIAANRSANGNVIVGDLFFQKAIEVVTGVVTFMDFNQGYYRVNGAQGSATTGVMVRMNDPSGRHSVQSGLGCVAGSLNCSADPRFTLDPDNYTNTSTTGFPVCIPSTVPRPFVDTHGIVGAAGATVTAKAAPNGTGDVLCPTTNRPDPAVTTIVGDARRFAPIQPGDHVTVTGNFETVGTTRFLSVWNTVLSAGLLTSTTPGQPDYVLPLANEIDAPAFNIDRIRAVFEGFTTDVGPPDVLIWTTHHDPTTNAVHEFPLGSVNGCTAVGRGACQPRPHQYHIQYHSDFPKVTAPAFSDCAQLRSEPRFSPLPCPLGGTMAEQFGVMSPIPHETQYRTGAKLADLSRPGGPTLFTIDVLGNDAKNGQYIFPMGIGLGGLTMPVPLGGALVDQMHVPYSFDGIPWNLDRRLSPGGCIGPCEATPQPLDPFPNPGLDPRRQAPAIPTLPYSDPAYTARTLSFASDRILSFVDAGVGSFDGDRTVLAWPPANPPAVAITPTPPLSAIKPVITGLTPVAGRVGSTVLIDGIGLAGARTVTFGSVPATSFRNVSPTQVSAVVPVGAQSGPIGVTTLVGTVPTTAFSAGRFTVVPAPSVSGFTPQSGPVGTPVTIAGTGFNSATNVSFNGVQAVFSVLSDTAIRTAVPTGATTGLITVTNPGGIGSRPIPFQVSAPAPAVLAVTSFAPASGPVGTSVIITGSGLTGATTVTFNGTTAIFTVGSDTSITATVPAGATTGPIKVTTPGGAATSTTDYTVA